MLSTPGVIAAVDAEFNKDSLSFIDHSAVNKKLGLINARVSNSSRDNLRRGSFLIF